MAMTANTILGSYKIESLIGRGGMGEVYPKGQDGEWCAVRVGDDWRQIRFHDYDEMFGIPGLYEKIIYDILQCRSPDVITNLLVKTVDEDGERIGQLRVLDLGAGNGMIGELLADHGTELIVGIDIIEEAAEATQRDRPNVYDYYHVSDLTELNNRGGGHGIQSYFITKTAADYLPIQLPNVRFRTRLRRHPAPSVHGCVWLDPSQRLDRLQHQGRVSQR